MKKNSFETILYSVAGVAILLVILIAFNVLTGTVKERVDLTKEHAYTLSPGTRAILEKLDTPVKIRFYYTRGDNGTPGTVFLKTYAQHVQDLLDEYKQASKGKIIIEHYDPTPDSDAEDSAHLDGVEGQMLPSGEKFYLGLAVSMLDTKEALPFLDPNRERLLEYDLSRAISKVANPEKPVVGIMSALPVFGAEPNPMMARMGQQPEAQAPWTLVTELKQDYTVKPVEMKTDKIDDDIKVLIVIHPKDITDQAQYAIDQFVMRGGKLIAFFDGTSLTDSKNQGSFSMPGGGSSLGKLVKAWGLEFTNGTVVADMNYKMRVGGRNGQPSDAPAVLSISGDGLNKDDITISELDNIWMIFSGVFTGTPEAGLKEEVLIKTTRDSQLLDGMMASFSGENILKDFKSSGIEYPLAIRLTGKFKTAFPDGKPKATDKDAKADDKTEETPLKETKNDNAVVLFGDADMLADQFTLRQTPTIFGNMVQPLNANLQLAQNVVEQMAGDDNLISVRSRATMSRPFTRIKEMQAKAEESYQSKIKELEESLQETQQKLNELQQNRSQEQGQRFILSPEQQKEVENFKKKRADVSVQLKQEKKKLALEIDSLENSLKWGNIVGMPALVALSGIGLAVIKRKRTSAK